MIYSNAVEKSVKGPLYYFFDDDLMLFHAEDPLSVQHIFIQLEMCCCYPIPSAVSSHVIRIFVLINEGSDYLT